MSVVYDAIVIGAGISGLLCATQMKAAGLSTLVLDKGRGVGGRMATRRMQNAAFDHGAQFFTVRDQRFQSFVDQWVSAGSAHEWFRHSPVDSNPEGYPRYCGKNAGITSIAKSIASELDIKLQQQVSTLARNDNIWTLKTAESLEYSSKWLVLTAPLPQSLVLVDTANLESPFADLEDAIRSMSYTKLIACLALLDSPTSIPEPGLTILEKENSSDGPVHKIVDNQQKKISQDPAVTIHSTSVFAEEHWDTPNETIIPMMIDVARPYLTGDVKEAQIHKWRFTSPINPIVSDKAYFFNPNYNLILAGDAFGGPRVEGSAISGIEAGNFIASSHS